MGTWARGYAHIYSYFSGAQRNPKAAGGGQLGLGPWRDAVPLAQPLSWPNLPPQSQDTPADAWHSGGPGACVLGTVKDPACLVQKEPTTLWGKRGCFERQVAFCKATEMVLGLSFQKGNDPTHGHWAAQHFHR